MLATTIFSILFSLGSALLIVLLFAAALKDSDKRTKTAGAGADYFNDFFKEKIDNDLLNGVDWTWTKLGLILGGFLTVTYIVSLFLNTIDAKWENFIWWKTGGFFKSLFVLLAFVLLLESIEIIVGYYKEANHKYPFSASTSTSPSPSSHSSSSSISFLGIFKFDLKRKVYITLPGLLLTSICIYIAVMITVSQINLSKANTAAKELSQSLTTVQSKISGINNNLGTSQEKITGINNALETAGTDVDNLQEGIQTAQGGISTVNAGITTAKGNVVEVNKIIVSTKREATDLQKQIVKISEGISDWENLKSWFSGLIGIQDKKLDEIQNSVNKLQVSSPSPSPAAQ